MRIVHVIEGLGAGGVTSVVLDLVAHQKGDGHQVIIFALSTASWDHRATGQGIKVVRGVDGIVAILHANRVHTHQRRCGLLAVLLGAGGKTIEHVHNVVHGSPRASFRGSAVVVAISETVANHLRKEFPQTVSRLTVIENAVTDASIKSNETQPPLARPLIIGAGRLETQKNPFLFLDIAQAFPDADFTWFGDGPLRQQFEDRMQQIGERVGKISLVGFADAGVFGAALSGADVLLITSVWEGTPLVALEALCRGVPVAMTPASDLAFTIAENEAGVVVDPHMLKESVAKIRSLARHDSRTAASKQARWLWASRYSWEVRYPAWRLLYRTMSAEISHEEIV